MSLSFKNEILRKAIHLSSIWMVIFIAWFGRDISIIFFASLLIAFFAFEYFRMSNQYFAQFINNNFNFVMRNHEQVTQFKWSALTGSFYFILSVLISLIIFDVHIAMTAILVMIFADTMAALIGKSIGRIKIDYFNKSIEGCIAFFMTCAAIIYMMMDISAIAIAAISLILSVAELISNKARINDNLSIVMIAGALLSLCV